MFAVILQSLRTIVTRAGVEDAGQSMVEYALILAVISVAAVGAMALLGPQVVSAIDSVTASF